MTQFFTICSNPFWGNVHFMFRIRFSVIVILTRDIWWDQDWEFNKHFALSLCDFPISLSLVFLTKANSEKRFKIFAINVCKKWIVSDIYIHFIFFLKICIISYFKNYWKEIYRYSESFNVSLMLRQYQVKFLTLEKDLF